MFTYKLYYFCSFLRSVSDTVRGSISLKQSKIRVPAICIETGLQLEELWYDSIW